MAAHAYAALVRRDPSRYEWRAALLQLAVDPIEKVVEAVYEAAPIFAEAAPDMVWRLFCLATQRASRTDEAGHGLHWSQAEAVEQSALADEAEHMMAEGITPTTHPAPTTAGRRDDDKIYRSDFHADALRLPIAPMLDLTTRGDLIAHAGSAIDWALACLDKKHGRGDTPFEWLFAFGGWLSRLVSLIPASEVRRLLIDRLDAAANEGACEFMDIVLKDFMIQRMLPKEPLYAATIDKWGMLIDWAIAQPEWTRSPISAGQHERGMAVSALFCGIVRGMVCGIDKDWPNLDAVRPAIARAAETFGTEQTGFAAVLALLRTRAESLMPQPGLEWIGRAVRARKRERAFWEHASNGERLVLLLREMVAAGPLLAADRAVVVEAADTLIEMGIKGAAFLQQDLVRPAPR